MKEYEVLISDLAREDLRSIYDYVCQISYDENATMVVGRILSKIASFKTAPERTEPFAEDFDGHQLRYVVAGRYRVIYTVDRANAKVAIVRIFSVGRDYHNLLATIS